MSEWVELDADDLNPPRTETFQGVQINVFLSPYDVPEGVRGYSEKSGWFVIEFKYIAEEPLRRERPEPHLVLRVGKNSGRLYKIEVDVGALGAQAVALNVCVPELVSTAIDSLKRDRHRRGENYDLAKKVISDRKEQVFKELAPA